MIRVASEGYAHSVEPLFDVMLINGVLHRAVRPLSHNDVLWIPVREYVGPVQHVDKNNRTITTPDREAPDADR